MITRFVEIFVVSQKDRKMNMIMLREKNRTILHINTHLTNTLQPSKKSILLDQKRKFGKGPHIKYLCGMMVLGRPRLVLTFRYFTLF